MKPGTIVMLNNYQLVRVDEVNDLITSMLKKTCWNGTNVNYLTGKSKIITCEPFTWDEIRHVVAPSLDDLRQMLDDDLLLEEE